MYCLRFVLHTYICVPTLPCLGNFLNLLFRVPIVTQKQQTWENNKHKSKTPDFPKSQHPQFQKQTTTQVWNNDFTRAM